MGWAVVLQGKGSRQESCADLDHIDPHGSRFTKIETQMKTDETASCAPAEHPMKYSSINGKENIELFSNPSYHVDPCGRLWPNQYESDFQGFPRSRVYSKTEKAGANQFKKVLGPVMYS